MVNTNSHKASSKCVMLVLTILMLLPLSEAVAQQQTVTVYVVYSRRQTEATPSKGLETRDKTRAEEHARILRRVQGPNGPIYAEVEVKPEPRTISKRETPPPRMPGRELPWKKKPSVGGDGEQQDAGSGKAKFFRPESEEQVDKRLQKINQAIAGGLTDDELYEAIKEGGVKQFLFDDDSLEGIELKLRMKELEKTRKELEAERKAIEQEEKVFQQQKRKLELSVKQTPTAETLEGTWLENGKSGRHDIIINANGTVIYNQTYVGKVRGRITTNEQTVSITTAGGWTGTHNWEFSGRFNNGKLVGKERTPKISTKWYDVTYVPEGGTKQSTPTAQQKSAIAKKQLRLRRRRQSLEAKSSNYHALNQQFQRDQQAYHSKRKHKQLGKQTETKKGFAVGGTAGTYKGKKDSE